MVVVLKRQLKKRRITSGMSIKKSIVRGRPDVGSAPQR